MPGSVANASPSDVLPRLLCRALRHSREFAAQENTYRDGERQTALLVATSRKTFEATVRLNAADLATWREFYEDHRTEPFYMYYPPETDPPYTYDATGTESNGRYTVVFTSAWEQSVGMGRSEVSIALVEVN